MACEICTQLDRIQKLEDALKEQKERSYDDGKELRESIHDIDRKVTEMSGNIRMISSNNERLFHMIDQMQCDIKELREKPVNKYDKITTGVITSTITVIISILVNFLYR